MRWRWSDTGTPQPRTGGGGGRAPATGAGRAARPRVPRRAGPTPAMRWNLVVGPPQGQRRGTVGGAGRYGRAGRCLRSAGRRQTETAVTNVADAVRVCEPGTTGGRREPTATWCRAARAGSSRWFRTGGNVDCRRCRLAGPVSRPGGPVPVQGCAGTADHVRFPGMVGDDLLPATAVPALRPSTATSSGSREQPTSSFPERRGSVRATVELAR